MSETQALVEEALKLIHENGIEPICKSSSSPRSPMGIGEPSHLARPAVAEPGNSARRAAAEVAKARTSSTTHHDRKCSVCRHRHRDEIEQEFLNWRSPQSMAREYGIAHYSSIYRHAHATGLFAQRATNLRMALSPIIEHCMTVSATASNVIRAVIAFAHLNDQGEWVEPPKTIIHLRAQPAEPAPPPAPAIQREEIRECQGAPAQPSVPGRQCNEHSHPEEPPRPNNLLLRLGGVPRPENLPVDQNPNRKLLELEYDSTS
jgi:hypothetical protein